MINIQSIQLNNSNKIRCRRWNSVPDDFVANHLYKFYPDDWEKTIL